MNRRRAISLVELLVVMSACTVILTMSVTLIHRVMHAHSRAREFYDVERNAWRLSQQFRRDVHQASEATIVDEAAEAGIFLRLSLSGDQTIEYRQREGVVSRALVQRGAEVSRETFAFPTYVALDIREDGPPRRLVLSLTADPATTPETVGKQPWNQYARRLALQIEAVPSRDLRFASARPVREQQP